MGVADIAAAVTETVVSAAAVVAAMNVEVAMNADTAAIMAKAMEVVAMAMVLATEARD